MTTSEPPTIEEKYDAVLGVMDVLTSRIALLENDNECLIKAVQYYADPEIYFGCGFFFDSPTGGFDDDFDEDHGHPLFDRAMPGKTAREALEQVAHDLVE